MKNIMAANEGIQAGGNNGQLLSKKYRTVLWIAFFVAFFNQWSGINFILYYAPEILEQAGLAAKESLGNSIAIGTNLVFTLWDYTLSTASAESNCHH